MHYKSQRLHIDASLAGRLSGWPPCNIAKPGKKHKKSQKKSSPQLSRPQEGNVSCDLVAVRIRIRIVRCEQPAKRQKHKPCETKDTALLPVAVNGEIVLLSRRSLRPPNAFKLVFPKPQNWSRLKPYYQSTMTAVKVLVVRNQS